MPCTLKNNSFVGEMGIFGGAYLNGEGRCRCGLFPYEHPEPQQLPPGNELCTIIAIIHIIIIIIIIIIIAIPITNTKYSIILYIIIYYYIIHEE